jgi:NADPH2:quinone reductase
MKAIRIHAFGGPEVLKLENLPDPRPQTGQVLVRLKAAGVNPVDTYIRAGHYGARSFPYTPGMDGAGVIEALGPGVQSVTVGDRVYVSGSSLGTYAELVAADLAQVHPLAAPVSFQQGAAIGVPYATAYYALFHRGHALPGEWVLVHGASGGVGTAATQLARAHGLRVIGTAGTEKGRALAEKEGAHEVLDHHAPDYLDQAVKLTGGRGLDLIVEMLANVNLAKDLKILAPRGRVVVIGSRGPVEIDPRDTMGRNADIRGMSLLTATPQEISSLHAALVAGLENGTLRPVVGKELPLGLAAQAHQDVLEPGAYGKIVLVP